MPYFIYNGQNTGQEFSFMGEKKISIPAQKKQNGEYKRLYIMGVPYEMFHFGTP